jgi:hypothetical protein
MNQINERLNWSLEGDLTKHSLQPIQQTPELLLHTTKQSRMLSTNSQEQAPRIKQRQQTATRFISGVSTEPEVSAPSVRRWRAVTTSNKRGKAP